MTTGAITSVFRILIPALALASLWGVSRSNAETVSDREVAVGDAVPAVRMVDTNQKAYSIPAPAGFTAVLFWATWSPRSEKALRFWQEAGKKYGDQPLTIVTLNAEHDGITEEERRDIYYYLTERKVELPVVMDEKLQLFDAYAVKALPTVFFLDPAGKVLQRYPGFPLSAPMDLEEELEIRLGIHKPLLPEQGAARGKLEYQPLNNALLYYNLALQLEKKGFYLKARDRLAVAIERDPDYTDPIRALEKNFFGDNRTREKERELSSFLQKKGLHTLAAHYGNDSAVPGGPEILR